MPAAREGLALPLTVFVEYHAAAYVRPPQPRPLPRPAMFEPALVNMSMPPITLAPEIAVMIRADRTNAISGAVLATPVPVQSAAPAPFEPPRFDMAYLRNPAPAYPGLSRRMKEQGRVILRVLVSASGDAQEIEVRTSSGSDRLDRSAIEAVRRWRFAPARSGAETIAAWAFVPILFQLDT